MNVFLHLLRKDLRRSGLTLVGWFALQLVLNGSSFWVWSRDLGLELCLEGHSLENSLLSTLGSIINVLIAFKFAVGLVADDPPDRALGTWRVLPINSRVMYAAKLTAALLFAIVPALLALLPFLLFANFGLSLSLAALAALAIMQAIAALLGFGLTPFSTPRAGTHLLLLAIVALGAVGVGYFESKGLSVDPTSRVICSRFVFAGGLFAAGLLVAPWSYYKSARRGIALSSFGFFTGASMLILLFWQHPTLETLWKPERVFEVKDFSTELSKKGASRTGRLYGLEPGQVFRPSSSPAADFSSHGSLQGEMFLSGVRDPARLDLNVFPVSEVPPLRSKTRDSEVQYQRVDVRFRSGGPLLSVRFRNSSNGADLSPYTPGPKDLGLIAPQLKPTFPSLQPQSYIRPGFDVRVYGTVRELRSVVDVPLHVGASSDSFGESLRISKVQRISDGTVRVSFEKRSLYQSSSGFFAYLIEPSSGRTWNVSHIENTSSVSLGLVSSQLDIMDFALPLDFSEAALSGLRYVKAVRQTVFHAVIHATQPEVHEELPPFTDEQVNAYQKLQAALAARRERLDGAAQKK